TTKAYDSCSMRFKCYGTSIRSILNVKSKASKKLIVLGFMVVLTLSRYKPHLPILMPLSAHLKMPIAMRIGRVGYSCCLNLKRIYKRCKAQAITKHALKPSQKLTIHFQA